MEISALFYLHLILLLVQQQRVPQAGDGYSIKGQLTGTDKNHSYAYLTRIIQDNLQNQVIDSTRIVAGTFIFKGKASEPNLHIITVKGVNGRVFFILENAPIQVKGKVSELGNAMVTGSPLTDEYTQYMQKYSLPAREELIANSRIAQEYRAKGDTAKADEYMVLNGQIMKKQFVIAEQYIREHPNRFGSLTKLEWGWQQFGIDKSKAYLRSFPAALQNHSIGKKIAADIRAKEEAAAHTPIGKPAFEFTQADTNGRPVKLSSLRGKYVLIDFWASWCGPCRKENPHLVKAYEKYKSYGFEIISVSLDEDRQKWLGAIRKDKLSWTNVSDLKGSNNQAAELYRVKAIPANFLLDPKGIIIDKEIAGQELDEHLMGIFSGSKSK